MEESGEFFFYLNKPTLNDLAALVAFKQPVDIDEHCVTKQLIKGMKKHKSALSLEAMKEKPKFEEKSFNRLEEIGLSPRRDAFRSIDYESG